VPRPQSTNQHTALFDHGLSNHHGSLWGDITSGLPNSELRHGCVTRQNQPMANDPQGNWERVDPQPRLGRHFRGPFPYKPVRFKASENISQISRTKEKDFIAAPF